MTPEQIRQTLASARIPYHFPGRKQTEAIHGDCVDVLVPVVSRLIEEATRLLDDEVGALELKAERMSQMHDSLVSQCDAALAEVERLRTELGEAVAEMGAEQDRAGSAEAAVARVEALRYQGGDGPVYEHDTYNGYCGSPNCPAAGPLTFTVRSGETRHERLCCVLGLLGGRCPRYQRVHRRRHLFMVRRLWSRAGDRMSGYESVVSDAEMRSVLRVGDERGFRALIAKADAAAYARGRDDALTEAGAAIETAGRAEVGFMAKYADPGRGADALDRGRLIGAEDAYKASIAIVRSLRSDQ